MDAIKTMQLYKHGDYSEHEYRLDCQIGKGDCKATISLPFNSDEALRLYGALRECIEGTYKHHEGMVIIDVLQGLAIADDARTEKEKVDAWIRDPWGNPL